MSINFFCLQEQSCDSLLRLLWWRNKVSIMQKLSFGSWLTQALSIIGVSGVGGIVAGWYQQSLVQRTAAEKRLIKWQADGKECQFIGPVAAQDDHKLLAGKTFTSPDGNEQVQVLANEDGACAGLLLRKFHSDSVYLPNGLFGSFFRAVKSEKILELDGSTKFYIEMQYQIVCRQSAIISGQLPTTIVQHILHYASFIDFCDRENDSDTAKMLDASLFRCNSLSWYPCALRSPLARKKESTRVCDE